MALFIDGEISTLEDLTRQDSQVLDVANIEGIDVTQKMAAAADELGVELEQLLGTLRSEGLRFWLRPPADVRNVVCTPALKMWHTFHTLELVYGDAYYSQLNDRYKAKRDQFRERSKWARNKLIQSGVGIACNPVPRGATPKLFTPPGAELPDGTYYVTVAWVNSGGEEGAPATPACVTTQGSTIVVNPGPQPKTATGWNVYVGAAPDGLSLQNSEPIAPAETWNQTNAPVTGGKAPSAGQAPSYMQQVPYAIQRG